MVIHRRVNRMTKKMYMGIDQYGKHYDGLVNPRKDLMELLYCKHADKMYVDNIDGSTAHIGYVISGLWITIYEVIPFEKTA
jgi:hypothetical protein